ncbi:hypothetical protein BLNAU_17242 [Blattamonas nauphoetae]|uniref:Uncharacterized protein n=1 Tax=Blattamonas nauphoetae TaxID=2049346 RepID=A0ABQ9X9B2_9EUKA|nr:hypothetical protein BLNAU_17242 [Blattamonas nauphoetae]
MRRERKGENQTRSSGDASEGEGSGRTKEERGTTKGGGERKGGRTKRQAESQKKSEWERKQNAEREAAEEKQRKIREDLERERQRAAQKDSATIETGSSVSSAFARWGIGKMIDTSSSPARPVGPSTSTGASSRGSFSQKREEDERKKKEEEEQRRKEEEGKRHFDNVN